jgi:microcystin degradation protein MlrC
MKLFVASLFHESNCFSPIPTHRSSFEQAHWYRPQGRFEPPEELELLGYRAFAREALARGHTVFPSLFAWTEPSRPLDRGSYLSLRDEILRDLESALPLDGVFLFLHGAQGVDGVERCEADLVREVRCRVGAAVPVVVELDLHANVTASLLREASAVLGCKEYPHTDFADVALQCLDLVEAAASGRARPVMAARAIPATGLYPTGVEPMASFVRQLRDAERDPRVLGVSAFHGFFGADTPDVCGSVVVVCDGDVALADALADRLAGELLDAMRRMRHAPISVEAALAEARATRGRVVLADRADNPGGGAAGDSTWILRQLVEERWDDVAFGLLWDPAAVELAYTAGVGAHLPLRIGGKVGPLSGDPLDVRCEVLSLRDDLRQAAFGTGEPRIPLHRSAAIRVGGIDIVLNARRQQVFDPRVFTGHGISLDEKRLIVVKSTQHFYEAFAPLADRILYCDPPGTVTLDLASMPYRRLRRPLFPLDSADGLSVEPLFSAALKAP